MATCLSIATMVLCFLGFFMLCISTGTRRWKEDINYVRGTRTYIGLWQACIESEGNNDGYPTTQGVICDKDYLRPHLNEPPPWFNATRALMLLSCIGTGFGLIFYITAFITDNSKKTGSRYFPCVLIIFISGLCAVIALSIFTTHRKWGVQYEVGGGEFYAQYWTQVEGEAVVDGTRFKIETWLRWSYGIGWGGVAMTLFALITAAFSDLTRRQVRY
ncbi:lens fiber membrane intrinsic protein-like [Clytia hemisphaerica]|uniref:Cnidarian restricted protein n=1 Tax=Clytia hemisphaerica TaxID=252671 RepID=A0A7M5V8C2_9CNID|eukprot:TCONS_00065487-protein